MNSFELEFTGVVSSFLCHYVPPRVVLYSILAYCRVHFFGGTPVLVELVTAWTVYQVVEQVRRLTRSNVSKQDRRFYSITTGAFVVVALPTLGASVWANTLEFNSILLGLLFPVASVGCAVGVALPSTVERYCNQRERECEKAQQERKAKAKERQQVQELDNLVASLGKAGETLRLYADNPHLSQVKVAQELGISRQAVGQHLAKLEQAGVIKKNGNGVELTV